MPSLTTCYIIDQFCEEIIEQFNHFVQNCTSNNRNVSFECSQSLCTESFDPLGLLMTIADNPIESTDISITLLTNGYIDEEQPIDWPAEMTHNNQTFRLK